MLRLKIRIRKNDENSGKRISALILDLFIKNDVSGATLWTGVDGFGKRGRSSLRLEGVVVNMPLIVEAVDGQTKLESLLSEVKRIVGNNGLVTIEDVYSI